MLIEIKVSISDIIYLDNLAQQCFIDIRINVNKHHRQVVNILCYLCTSNSVCACCAKTLKSIFNLKLWILYAKNVQRISENDME